jgi:formylglycine-generating enzyme required for sulfatase activity
MKTQIFNCAFPKQLTHTLMKIKKPSASLPSGRVVLLLFFYLLMGTFMAWAGSPPVVTNVTASQQAGTKLVNISYTVSDPDSPAVNVFVLVSTNSGATWTVPASTFTGAYGTNIAVTPTPTAKSVVWNAGADWDGNYSTACRVRVLVNDAGLLLIPAGSYLRGTPPGLNDSDIADAPQFSVFVSAVYMDSTLVTGGRWNLVVEGYASGHGYNFVNPSSFKAISHPVQSVDWFDAVKWCNARSEMEGATPVYYTDAGFTTVYRTGEITPFVKPGANGYRLPTEAEWEKAARGGASGHRFPWSDADTISESRADYNGNTATYLYDLGPSGFNATYATGAQPYTSPVGSFAVNGYGLSDMAGNVFEWCGDWYGSGYYAAGQTDPQGPSSGSNRVLRGGDWSDFANGARCAFRGSLPPTFVGNICGFRCVKGL